MRYCSSPARRAGASAVEFACTCSVALFLVFATIVGGLGVFRFQEVAHLAREGARYASTHGGQYSQDGMPAKTGVAAVTSSSDVRSYVSSRANLLDSSRLTVAVAWSAPSTINPINM